MRRIITQAIGLTLVAAQPLFAGTFEKTAIAPDVGVDALTRQVARDQVGRDVFSNPYSAVTLATLDVYDVFPYTESRTFQFVTDTRWNRIVYGETGRTLRAFDGTGTALGHLSDPRGMAVDEMGRVYVADAGNDRVVVLQASTQFGDVTLAPRFQINGLHDPHDVAYSDGGTPFVPGDDALYVADTGKNRVVAYALGSNGAQFSAALGDLGSGPGKFAGPMAITVGRKDGVNTRDVYVADAHSRRIIRLRHEGETLRWVAEVRQDADIVTSLDTDQWGNLYASAPNQGVIRKFDAALEPVAELRDAVANPKSFDVPFVNVFDHRAGTSTRVGQPTAVSVDRWTNDTGMRRWALGVDVTGLTVRGGASPSADFMLTDQAQVAVEVLDAATGHVLARAPVGTLSAGLHSVPLALLAGTTGDRLVRVAAVSSYAQGGSASAQAAIGTGLGGAVTLPSRPMLLGNSPNPAVSFTRIAFALPNGMGDGVALRVYDAGGRLMRTFAGGFSPGANEVLWDGTDASGARAPAGVYFYRLDAGVDRLTQKLVFVR